MDQRNSVDCLGGAATKYCYPVAGRYTGQPSLITQPHLCEECNKKQALKIQELNSFEPLRECDFQCELDVLKQKLDQRYKLCQTCHNIVNCHLKAQAVDLKTFLLGSHLQQSKSTPKKLLRKSSSPESISLLLAQLTCVLLASMMICSESLSNDHHTCSETLRFWNSSNYVISSAFFSNFTIANLTNTAKHVVLHFPGLLRVLMISFLEEGLELVVCLSSLTKSRYLQVSLVCLLLNILVFLQRKTREVFWLKANCRWRFAGAAVCWLFSTSSFLFSLLSYSRALGTQKKRRYQVTPSHPTPETHHTVEPEIMMDMDNECTPSNNKIATELDYNLNGLSLGLPAQRRNGFNTHSSPGISGRAGSFWSQNAIVKTKESPLVSMYQRPLIVPATLNFSGLRQRLNTNNTQGALSVTRPLGVNSYTISSDDDTLSDSTDEEHTDKNLPICSDKQRKSENAPRKIKRSPSSCKTRTTSFLNARTFLLVSSLLLNVYFVALFTEWPVRILQSLLKIFKR